MNPSPDRGKECLPPKKRESRQGSTEHQVPLDEFKPPVPLRNRSITGRGEGSREPSERDLFLTNTNPHLLHSPPPHPAPAPGLAVPIPWHLSYSPSAAVPLFPGQVSERRSSGSPSWRDDPLSSPLSHHSRWLRGEGALPLPSSPSASSSPSFKTPFPTSSREMWSYINSGRRDYGSSLFSPSYLFSHHSLYNQDPSLAEARHRYLGKRPNGLDGPGSRTASLPRPLPIGDYRNDINRTRIDISPHSSQANGGRRQQEAIPFRPERTFLQDSQVQEGCEPHSLLQDRHLQGMIKSSTNVLSPSSLSHGTDSRASRGLLDHLGATSAEAQIYYSLGCLGHSSPQASAYSLYSQCSSGTPLYNLQKESVSRQHNPRNSVHSPLGLTNNNGKSERDHDKGQEKDKVIHKDRECGRDKEKKLQTLRDQEKNNDRQRRREGDAELSPTHLDSSSLAIHPSAPALLPHFTKGSLIELASGQLKQVEELRTEDFLKSADTSPEFHLSTCTVLLISPGSTQGFSHLQVHLKDRNTQELLKVLVEYPFFVQDQGWSSCRPQRTLQMYGLSCRQLMEGDVCLALTPTPTPTQKQRTQMRTSSKIYRSQLSSKAVTGSSSLHSGEMPPPPPPPPLPHHPPPTLPPPSCTVAAQPQVQNKERPRKRRWSAPDTLSSTGTDERLLDLPHGLKLMKWQ